jgi:acetylornithine deacetylase/succinyl-diaminopimelate desuccinylase-like protein
MDAVELTRKLVSIPSYVNERADESEVGRFIEDYLQGLDYLHVERQPVEGRRFNVIAHDGHPARLMFCCHMDTVQLSGKWEHQPFSGDIVGDQLFGLGAVDMKGGTACLLDALATFKETGTQGLFLLFDVDEEYEFKGMKKFIAERQVQPELVVLPEPGFAIQNGHRGLLEIHFRVRGQSAHASRPSLGKNAIIGAVDAVQHLITQMEHYEDPILGASTCNLAALTGGIAREESDAVEIVATSPNKIPDIADLILDIRPASPELRADTVERILRDYLSKRGYEIETLKIALDYGSLLVPKDQLATVEMLVRDVLGSAEYADIRTFGYGEGQMLNEEFGVPCVYFGPEPEDMPHQPDEYVSIASLGKASAIFARLIEHYCLQGDKEQ